MHTPHPSASPKPTRARSRVRREARPRLRGKLFIALVVLAGFVSSTAAAAEADISLDDRRFQELTDDSSIMAWPKKYTGVGLQADSNEIAVEAITLAHEGFEHR